MELKGGRQPGLKFDDSSENEPSKINISGQDTNLSGFILRNRSVRPARSFAISDVETAAHEELIAKMNNPVWLR